MACDAVIQVLHMTRCEAAGVPLVSTAPWDIQDPAEPHKVIE
jgi:hypothetical protein